MRIPSAAAAKTVVGRGFVGLRLRRRARRRAGPARSRRMLHPPKRRSRRPAQPWPPRDCTGRHVRHVEVRHGTHVFGAGTGFERRLADRSAAGSSPFQDRGAMARSGGPCKGKACRGPGQRNLIRRLLRVAGGAHVASVIVPDLLRLGHVLRRYRVERRIMAAAFGGHTACRFAGRHAAFAFGRLDAARWGTTPSTEWGACIIEYPATPSEATRATASGHAAPDHTGAAAPRQDRGRVSPTAAATKSPGER